MSKNINKKFKINILGFGERFCSNNVEYKLYFNGNYYTFYKKGTYICHNEYGPAYEHKDGSYSYCINNELHRLNDYAVCNKSEFLNYKKYYVIGKSLGDTKEKFIKKFANILIPKKINK